jgi:hypothetical protein
MALAHRGDDGRVVREPIEQRRREFLSSPANTVTYSANAKFNAERMVVRS